MKVIVPDCDIKQQLFSPGSQSVLRHSKKVDTHLPGNMKVMLLVFLGLVALAAALPDEILDFEGDDAEHEQEGEPGHSVTGEYTWESPEGIEYVVKYIADDKGYRVLESNAVPSAGGVRADGEQADLEGDEDDDDK